MPTKEQLAELRRDIAAHVAEGFDDRDGIVARFAEYPDEESYGGCDEELVERLVDAAIAAHHRKQARWIAPTDCDKLDAAFRGLNRRRVVARQHFTDCSADGHQLLLQELKSGRPPRAVGYAFYHMQDTESAVQGGAIHIKYDALLDDPVQKRRVGRMVADALTAAGLKAVWDGNPDLAVVVKLKWRKRRKDTPPKRK